MPAMPTPNPRRAARWGLAAALLVVLLVAGAVAYVLLHAPHNVSHPNLSFTAPTAPTAPPSRPHPRHRPAAQDTFVWPRYGYDAGRTRYVPNSTNLDPPLRVGWRYQDYALLEFPPVIYHHALFLIDDDGSAKSIDNRNGHPFWQRKIGTLAAASPGLGVSQQLVYVPLLSVNQNAGQNPGNGRLDALSMRTGRVVWSRVIPAGTESSPMVWGNTVYFGDGSGAVYALNARTGATRWIFHAQGAVKGGPSYAGGNLYFGDYSGHAYALNARSGAVVWSVGTNGTHFGFGSGNFYSSPAIAFGRVYMGNTDGRVYSFALRTGQLAWATSTGAYVYASPAVADVPGFGPTVYLGSYDGNFYAFDARSGAIRWTHPSGGRISGSPTIVGNVVYYSDLGHRATYGLDLRTGRKVFSFPDGAFNPVICDLGAIYMSGYSMLYQMLPQRAHPKPQKHRRSRKKH